MAHKTRVILLFSLFMFHLMSSGSLLLDETTPISFDLGSADGREIPDREVVDPSGLLNAQIRRRANRSILVDAATLTDIRPPFIAGLRVEEEVNYDDQGVALVPEGVEVTLRLFGDDLNVTSQFRFVQVPRQRGVDCDDLPFSISTAHVHQLTAFSALVSFHLPDRVTNADDGDESLVYICSMGRTNGQIRWIHQGQEPGLLLKTFRRTALPLWFQLVIIAVLLSFSGLFSGLNLGLMALDTTDLKIYENIGSEKERRYARAIAPVRNHGNYLLCTLLLGNVVVNSSLTILMDELTSGIIAVVTSTLGIVILGEIVPQAICSRHGLAVGAHTIWITKFLMLITSPLSYPISLVLNSILGKEIGSYYDRERLKELIKVTNEYHDLEKEEMNIISGALEMRKKTAADIMTRLVDIFMLHYDSVLDFETVGEILKQGFSRVPIYDGERTNIIGLLFTKELILLDPGDAIPLKTLCRFYEKQCHFVFDDTTLDVVFRDLIEGSKGHMAFVQRVNSSEGRDPLYETVGLITLEDVIEEVIQAEIVDETDVWIDNRSKRRRKKNSLLRDFVNFASDYQDRSRMISPQLASSALQFLSSSVDPFRVDLISESVLRRLLQRDTVVQFISVKNRHKSDCEPDGPEGLDVTLIYQQGTPADYFVLILEGCVEVTVFAREKLVYQSGPFTHFGSSTLSSGLPTSSADLGGSEPNCRGRRSGHETFISDYTIRALSDVTLVRVSQFLYQAARSATLFERAQSSEYSQAVTTDPLSDQESRSADKQSRQVLPADADDAADETVLTRL